jgi:dihydropteroate synthase
MSQAIPTSSPAELNPSLQSRQELDDSLSQRFIALDPSGYFLIKIDLQRQELVVEHYGNTIDERGLATDPDTGEVLRCRGADQRAPLAVLRGRTAKELGIQLTEGEGPFLLSRLDHALYLGRELQKAENCLLHGKAYIQD